MSFFPSYAPSRIYLQLLHSVTVPFVFYSTHSICSQCCQVFWHQLSAWILHGVLIDPYDEFFIQRAPTAPLHDVSADSSSSALLPRRETEQLDWSFEFSIRLSCIPLTLISFDVAHTIIFSGKAMRVLQQSIAGAVGARTDNLVASDFSPIPSEDTAAIVGLLQNLRDNVFIEPLLIHQALQHIQHCLASHLWTLIVSKADLPVHLKAMKDFFLLARGEFYQVFIEESMSLMALPPSNRAGRDINDGPFAAASVKCGLEDDAMFRLFRLKLHRSSFQVDFAKILRGDQAALSSSAHWTPSAAAIKQLDEFVVVGSASWQRGAVRLVADTPSQTGACWFNDQMNVDRAFRMQFQFCIDSSMAEGFAVVFQNHSYKCVGDGGSGIGFAGIPNSIAIEFDVNQSPDLQEQSGNHVSIQTCWVQPNSAHNRSSIASGSPAFQLSDSRPHTAMIEYTSGTLKVFVDDFSDGRELCSVKCDMFRMRPEAGRAWVGFTASTSKSPHRSQPVAPPIEIPGERLGVSISSWSFSGAPLPLLSHPVCICHIVPSPVFQKSNSPHPCDSHLQRPLPLPSPHTAGDSSASSALSTPQST